LQKSFFTPKNTDMNTYEIYVGGSFQRTGQPLEVRNPYNQEVIATTFLAGHEELEIAIIKAQESLDLMKQMPVYQKYDILMKIAHEIKSNAEYLASVLCMESAKPMKFALGEINRAVQTFIAAAEESKRIPAEIMSLDWTPDFAGKEGIIKYFPLGIVAGISPFNFPMNLVAHKVAPAIAAGCPIVVKPARATPLSTLELARIIDKTDLPKGAFSVLPMDRIAGNQLVTDERFKLITFTGSPDVGWKMKNDAGKKKVVLEMGGNAGLIITNDCDIDAAVKRSVVGAFAFSGQVCIHTQRIYVEKNIFEIFKEKFVLAVKQLKQGDPIDKTTDISVVIDEENAIRIELWIEEAVREGATLLCGGKRDGAFVEPTVLTNTKESMKVSCQEIFGPVVIIEPFENFEKAVQAVNNSKYGLQAGVFTNSITQMNYAFKHLDVGGLMINDIPGFRTDHMPYGGIKDSGLGREGVKYAMMDMLEPKIMVKSN